METEGGLMAKKIYAAWNFQEYEGDAFADYLELKAQAGWHLKSISSTTGFLCFEKGEPRSRRFFAAAFFGSSMFESTEGYKVKEFRRQYEEAGWTLLCGGVPWQIFYTDDPGLPRPRLEKEQLSAVRRRTLSFGRLAPVLVLIGMLSWFLFRVVSNDPCRFFANGRGMLTSASMIFLVGGLIWENFGPFFWYCRMERRMRESGSLQEISFARVRRRNLARAGYVAFWFVMLVCGQLRSPAAWAASLFQSALIFGICMFMLWWVRERGCGTKRENIVGYFVGAIVLCLLVNVVCDRIFSQILPEEKREEPKPVLDYPVDFSAYGYEPWEEPYRYLKGSKTFLAAWQSENLKIDLPYVGGKRQESMGVDYYSSPVSAILSATRDCYPQKWLRDQKYQQEQWQEGSATVVRYRFAGYREEDLYLLYDEHRLLVLDFSYVPEEETVMEMAREFVDAP